MSNTETSTLVKAYGKEAIRIMTDYMLGDDAVITEHDAGIDVDNAGRRYDHERETDFEHVLWSATSYLVSELPDYYTLDDLFTVEYEPIRNGCTDTRVHWFHIHEDIFDSESLGTHFEFWYGKVEKPVVPTVYKTADELEPGDTLAFPFNATDPYRVVLCVARNVWTDESGMVYVSAEYQQCSEPSNTLLRLEAGRMVTVLV